MSEQFVSKAVEENGDGLDIAGGKSNSIRVILAP
jgi:hypothetical protein